MTAAAVTFVYNENFNLPIWRRYYGQLFGDKNLYVVDRGTNDGSTSNLGDVNVLRVPRRPFDENEKTNFMSSFHEALTSFYDAVIITDCDEIIAPDPGKYRDLADYVERLPGPYVNAIGIDVLHLITEEPPIDPERPILSQRRYGRFHSRECKHLLSRTPIRWLPGLHSSNKKPEFDPYLYMFHLKWVDFSTAVKRQQTNVGTQWSEKSLARNYGAHHRHDQKRFVQQGFLVPIDIVNRSQLGTFEFTKEIDDIISRTVLSDEGYYLIPMDISKYVTIPERFSAVF